MTNQSDKQVSIREATATTLDYNGDWHALFDLLSIDNGSFDGRLLSYINTSLNSSYINLPSAMQAFAEDQGFDNWDSMGSFAAGTIATSYTFASQSALVETNTKSGTTSTRRDVSGNWQTVPTQTVRYHKSEDLDIMCMLVEAAVTNLLTCQKYDVTATTNLTKGGDAASTLAVADDATTTSLIGASELQDLITNNALFLLDNTGGGTPAYVEFSGATGSVSKCSQSVFVAGDATNFGSFGLYNTGGTANAVQTTLNGAGLVRYRQDNVTPSATTNTMRLYVEAGKVAYFIVPQLEVYRHCTSPVISTGTGAVTRNRDDISAVYENSNAAAGGWAAKFYLKYAGESNEGIFGLTDAAGGSANSVGMRMLSTRPMLEAQIITNSGDDSTEDIAGIIPTRQNWCSVYWDSAQATGVAPNLRYERVTRDAFSSPLTEIWFGKDRQYGNHGTVEIYEVVLWTGAAPTLNNIADVIIPDDAIAIFNENSQSNMRVYGRDETTGSNKNLGEIEIVSQLQTLYPSNTPFWLDTSKSGSSMYKIASEPNRWIDPESGGINAPLATKAIEIANAFARKGRVIARISNIGETDQGSLTKTELKDYKNDIRTNIETGASSLVGLPYIYIPPANRTIAADSGYNIWREGDRELAVEVANTYIAPETAWLDMDAASHNLHIASSGTVQYAQYIARLSASLDGVNVTGGVLGAEVYYVERDGVDVYVSHAYDGDATTFLPTTAIQGAVFLDDSVEQTITAHILENAFTSKITLSGAPSGVEELWYGYGTLDYVSNYDDIMIDNDTNVLPVKFMNELLPYAKYDFNQFSGLTIWQNSSVSTTVAQRDDLTGNGYHAVQNTASTQPTIAAAAQFNKDALQFDNSNDNMIITTNAAFALITNESTWEFVWEGTPTASFKTLLRNDFASRGIIIQNDGSNNILVKVSTDAGQTTLGTRPSGVFDGAIHHCVLRLDNGSVDFFKDGVKSTIGTYDVGISGFGSSSNIQINNGANTKDYIFTVYDNALSDVDIANKYLHYKAMFQV